MVGGIIRVVIVIRGITVFKSNAGVGTGFTTHAVHLINDVIRHGELRPTLTVETETRFKTEEPVATLGVPGGKKSNGTAGAAVHGVVCGFMGMDICAKRNTYVAVVIKTEAG